MQVSKRGAHAVYLENHQQCVQRMPGITGNLAALPVWPCPPRTGACASESLCCAPVNTRQRCHGYRDLLAGLEGRLSPSHRHTSLHQPRQWLAQRLDAHGISFLSQKNATPANSSTCSPGRWLEKMGSTWCLHPCRSCWAGCDARQALPWTPSGACHDQSAISYLHESLLLHSWCRFCSSEPVLVPTWA